MKKKTMLTQTHSKICNRCKVEQNTLKNFKNQLIERVSGLQQWVHPWCNGCRAKVKEMWGTNWVGGKNGCKEKKTSTSILRISKRKSNKTSNSKRVNKTVSGRKNIRHRVVRKPSRSKDMGRSGTIIKTLKNIKDNIKE